MEKSRMSPGMLGGEEAEMAPECSMSYGGLIQQSATVLRNECAILETRIQEKTRDVKETQKLCARQAENVLKQQPDLERRKVKTHIEEMQNKAYMNKINDLREKLKVLDKYFDKWGNTINPMLNQQNELEEIIKQLKVKLETKEASCKQHERDNMYFLEQSNKAFLELQEQYDQEKTELQQIKEYLTNQHIQQQTQEKDLKQQLRKLQSECREKTITIDILEPQKTEIKNTLEKFETELATAKEQMCKTSNKLEASLHEAVSKKNQLLTDIDTADRKLKEIINGLREKENEIAILHSKQKQLNTEEEEYAEIVKNEQLELQKLESNLEELKLRFNTLMELDLENVSHRATSVDLQNECENYKKKIAENDINERDICEEIKELNKSIDEMETERENVITEHLMIEEKISKLQKEFDDNENEDKDLSAKIEKTLVELQDENDLLKTSLQDLNKQLDRASETKNKFEATQKNLERDLDQANTISQQSDIKLFSYHEECNTINNNYIEEIKILNEAMQRSIEDYEKTMADSKLNDKTKQEICQLTIDLNNKNESYSRIIQQCEDSYTREIESKFKVVADMRAQWEREFKNKELLKTDNLVELKEIKVRIEDLKRQNVLVEKEIKTKTDVLMKCDNLIHKLETKFNKVAQVAITSSQSVVDPASQRTNFATPVPQRKRMKVESPGSESSGKTFNPDDVDVKKIFQNRPSLRPNITLYNTQNVPKKKTVPAPPKKKTDQNEKDDWGFVI